MNCYLCSTPLTPKNDSAEHIIPNSIGGMRKVKGFICRDCNGNAGEKWDSDLAKQMNKIALFFCIIRDRGDNPTEIVKTSTGEKLRYGKNSLQFPIPQINKVAKEDGVHIQISASDITQARQVLKGLKRSHPTLDIDKALANTIDATTYPDGYLEFDFSFGGLSVGKSFVKTALAFLSENGINPKICEKANAYIFNEDEPCFGYYYHQDLLINRPIGMPIHCIGVKGNKAKQTIQAYLEYFGAIRLVISLSSNYQGEDFKYLYAIDPTTGKEISIDFELDFDELEIKKIYEYDYYNSHIFSDAWHKVIGPEVKRKQELHLKEALDKANDAMKQRFAGNDEIDTEEFVKAYLDHLKPYILNSLNKRNMKI